MCNIFTRQPPLNRRSIATICDYVPIETDQIKKHHETFHRRGHQPQAGNRKHYHESHQATPKETQGSALSASRDKRVSWARLIQRKIQELQVSRSADLVYRTQSNQVKKKKRGAGCKDELAT
jgi:hypothetical protein